MMPKKAEVKISPDKMTAFMSFQFDEADSEEINIGSLERILSDNDVRFGIDKEALLQAFSLIKEKKDFSNLVVAKGERAKDGENAYIKYHFAKDKNKVTPKELEDGKIDFYNISLIENVVMGQLLLEKIPPTPGLPGKTVTGEVVYGRDGNGAKMPAGKNLFVSEDGLKAFAGADGHVKVTGGTVSIETVYTVNGDVDFSTGNIDYLGNVVIKGNIREGFKVVSEGTVEVYGTVEGGIMQAGGDIIIKKGIRGLGKSRITAKGDIYSMFIENAYVESEKDVIVGEAIMHSVVNSGSGIFVSGRKGLIVGGLARAEKSIVCKNVGSSLATKTQLEVGINPKLLLEYRRVDEELKITSENLDKTRKALNILGALKQKLGTLPTDKLMMEAKLISTQEELMNSFEILSVEHKDLEEKMEGLKDGYIEVLGSIKGGVEVTIGKYKRHFSDEYYKSRISVVDAEIEVSPAVG